MIYKDSGPSGELLCTNMYFSLDFHAYPMKYQSARLTAIGCRTVCMKCKLLIITSRFRMFGKCEKA